METVKIGKFEFAKSFFAGITLEEAKAKVPKRLNAPDDVISRAWELCNPKSDGKKAAKPDPEK